MQVYTGGKYEQATHENKGSLVLGQSSNKVEGLEDIIWSGTEERRESSISTTTPMSCSTPDDKDMIKISSPVISSPSDHSSESDHSCSSPRKIEIESVQPAKETSNLPIAKKNPQWFLDRSASNDSCASFGNQDDDENEDDYQAIDSDPEPEMGMGRRYSCGESTECSLTIKAKMRDRQQMQLSKPIIEKEPQMLKLPGSPLARDRKQRRAFN